MGNDQGRRHSRKKRRRRVKNRQPITTELRFVDSDDDYIWENHVIGRLPFKEPEEVEIVFHSDQLWQDNEECDNVHFLKYLLRDGPHSKCQLSG